MTRTTHQTSRQLHVRLFLLTMASMAMMSCKNDQIIGPSAPQASRPELSSASAAPTVTTVSGVTNASAGISNGLAAMDCGKVWNGSRVINDQAGAYTWMIDGKNFGATIGSVTIAGRIAKVNSWSDKRIIIDPTVPWNWGPMSTIMTVLTASGKRVGYGVDIAPAIATRIFGQCTYYVARRRKEMGLSPSPAAFDGYSPITSSYVPRVGDQYWWSWAKGKHTAIVNAVAKTTARDGTATYAVTLGEQNVNCNNGLDSFSAAFAVRGNSIVTKLMHPTLGETRQFYR